MSTPSPERNLLFGLLALQNGFISRDQLVAAFGSWTADKAQLLDQILLQQGALNESQRDLLIALTTAHLAQNGGDPYQSLAQLSAIGSSARHDLERLNDEQLKSCLSQLPPVDRDKSDDPFVTVLQQAGQGSTGGRFVILRPHAAGGLGQVAVALDTELHREVALKEIRPQFAQESAARSRFVREAEITGGLEHPGIVPVYGLGAYGDGRPYYAMKFVKGRSLKTALEEFHQKHPDPSAGDYQGVEFRQLLQRFLDVCNAMQYAHDRGVLHRDLKPGNIMLGQYGETLVIDWGLAKPLGESEHAFVPTSSGEKPLIPQSSLSGSGGETQPGSAIGTPNYMSPEQAAGNLDDLGPATDVYSLGATLYHILTGKPPIEKRSNETFGELLQRVQRGDHSPPSAVKLNIPRALEAICLKAMSLDKEDRYTPLGSISEDLEHWLAADELAKELRREMDREVAQRALCASQISRIALELQLHNRIAAQHLLETFPRDRRAWEYYYLWRQFEGTPLTLRRNTSPLKHIWFSSDGAQLITVSSDNIIRIWGAHTGVELETRDVCADEVAPVVVSKDGTRLATFSRDLIDAQRVVDLALSGQTDNVYAVSLSADEVLITGASWNRSIAIWEAQTGRLLLTLSGITRDANTVAFSWDRSVLVSGSWDGSIEVWNVANESKVMLIRGHAQSITSLAFSPDNCRFASGSLEGTIKVWDTISGAELMTIQGHPGSVTCVLFSPDGSLLASGSDDNDQSIKLWNAQSGDELLTLSGHTNAICSICFSPDGTRLASTSLDQAIKLWDVRLGTEAIILRGHDDSVNSLCFNLDGTVVVSGSSDGTVKVWCAISGAEIQTLRSHTASVKSVSFSSDGLRFASGSLDGTLRIWDARTGAELKNLAGHTDAIWSVTFSSDNCRLASSSAGSDQTIKIWDTQLGTELLTLLGHVDYVTSARFSPDNTQLISGSWDRTAKSWDVETGLELQTFRGHTDFVTSVCFSPDGARIASASWDQTIKVWDSLSGEEQLTLRGHTGRVNSVDFNPDGSRLVSASDDQTIKIWDVNTGMELLTLRGHSDRVSFVRFNTNGTTVGSASDDKKVMLWNAQVAAETLTLRGHSSFVTSVSFSPDGTRLASGSWDRSVKLWNPQTGAELATLRGHFNRVSNVGFTADGTGLVSQDEAGKLLVWRIPEGDLRELGIVPESFSWNESPSDPFLQAVIRGNDIQLVRIKPNHDPWADDAERRKKLAPKWHADDAQKAVASQSWYAAAFHLGWLLRDQPNSADLKARYDHAVAELKRMNIAPPKLPEPVAVDFR